MPNTILFDEFVNVKTGEAYRLFPFGRIVKNGKVREITPEFAATIKLPHFKPAIKLGSHEDVTPAGGHIVALEVRADGLYAVPEFNDKGTQALQDGAYKYHSPEIIWEGGLENPTDGSVISAPLIMGDALLHTPHLGEAAALYSVEVIESNKENQSMENVTVPASLWEKFIAFIDSRLAPPPAPEPVEVIPDEYKAAVVERDELKAKFEEQQKEAEKKARVEKFDAELKATKADPALADLLSDLPEEKADAIMRQFKALSEQIKEPELTGEVGKEGEAVEGDPKAQFNALVLAIMNENKLTNYNAAFEVAKVQHADLFKAWAK